MGRGNGLHFVPRKSSQDLDENSLELIKDVIGRMEEVGRREKIRNGENNDFLFDL